MSCSGATAKAAVANCQELEGCTSFACQFILLLEPQGSTWIFFDRFVSAVWSPEIKTWLWSPSVPLGPCPDPTDLGRGCSAPPGPPRFNPCSQQLHPRAGWRGFSVPSLRAGAMPTTDPCPHPTLRLSQAQTSPTGTAGIKLLGYRHRITAGFVKYTPLPA